MIIKEQLQFSSQAIFFIETYVFQRVKKKICSNHYFGCYILPTFVILHFKTDRVDKYK